MNAEGRSDLSWLAAIRSYDLLTTGERCNTVRSAKGIAERNPAYAADLANAFEEGTEDPRVHALLGGLNGQVVFNELGNA